MNKKLREVLNGLGMLATAFVMMGIAIAFIYAFTAVFHTNAK